VIRVVFDANVIVSGLFASDGPLAEIVDRWRIGHIRLIVWLHTLDEASRAWGKPCWRSRFSTGHARRALKLLREEADVIPITIIVTGVASHPEDDAVLATAVSGQAHFLVAADKALLNLGRVSDVTILSPRAFHEPLNQSDIR